jgi:formylmethanofuran dehydrogenase subunit B
MRRERRSEFRGRRSEVGVALASAANRLAPVPAASAGGTAQIIMNPMGADPSSKLDAAAREAADIPCPFCACLCDDLRANVRCGKVIEVTGACELARPWFLGERQTERPTCRIDGRPADIDDALAKAAELLASARYPLLYGLGRASCEAQAVAVEIAELLRGALDTPADRGSLDALQTVGEITCTLGEIGGRADLIVVWNADPAKTHPRFFERYAPRDSLSFARHFTVISSRPTATSELADEWISLRDGGDFDAAVVLRALATGLPLDEADVRARTGATLATWRELFVRMQRARYGVLLSAESSDSPPARRTREAIAALVRDLNHHTRFVSLALPEAGNLLGAATVLTWRTGYPTAIDFSLGYPRSNPAEFAAERLLASGEVDAALVICDDLASRLDESALRHFHAIPTISLDWRQTATTAKARIVIPLTTPGVESGGTMFRVDGVPLALRPPITAQFPADDEALRKLTTAIRFHNR